MRKLLLPASLLFLLFVAILLNLYLLQRELGTFYLFVVKEETSRVESVVRGTLAGGGDPVKALTTYMKESRLLKGASFNLEGREIIVPGSDISPSYLRERLKVGNFSFTLYFDFSYVSYLKKRVLFILISLIVFSFLFTAVVVWLTREYFRNRILYERERQEKEKLEAVNLVIHSLIHEVKNRLNVLRLFLYRLENSFNETYLKNLKEEIDRLGRYMEETADLRKPLKISRERVEISQLVKKTASKLKELIESKGIELSISVEREVLLLDPEKISSLLFDLLKNGIEAVEESSRKEIRVLGKREGNFYAIYVMDSGGKLPSGNLFEPFRSTKKKGFGLGLYNAKRIAEAHGGRLEAYTKNGWTIFKFLIPLT